MRTRSARYRRNYGVLSNLRAELQRLPVGETAARRRAGAVRRLFLRLVGRRAVSTAARRVDNDAVACTELGRVFAAEVDDARRDDALVVGRHEVAVGLAALLDPEVESALGIAAPLEAVWLKDAALREDADLDTRLEELNVCLLYTSDAADE